MRENLRKIAVRALVSQKWHSKSKCRRFLGHYLFSSFRASQGKFWQKW